RAGRAEGFRFARRPAHLDPLSLRGLAQPQIGTGIVGGGEAGAAADPRGLGDAAGGDAQARAQPIAVALRAAQPDLQPVVPPGAWPPPLSALRPRRGSPVAF